MGAEGPIEVHAPAKVNLFLRILAREEGGHHQLETLFQQVELADRITLEQDDSGGVSLEVQGAELGPPRENLAWRAATAVLEAVAGGSGSDAPGRVPPGIRIALEKRIPHGAGLGGGSSDAAAVLRGVNRLLGHPLSQERLLDLAAPLGADVPAFLSPSPTTLAWGRGDRLLPLPALPGAPVVLALPEVPVSTPEAYRRLAAARARTDARPRKAALLDLAALRRWSDVAHLAENDFEETVLTWHPALAAILGGLRGAGATLALLSGSGSALFGVFGDGAAAARAAERLEGAHPGVRFLVTRTLTTSVPDPDVP